LRLNRIKSAFYENGNLVGLAGAVAASLALLNPIPAIAAVVAEAVYLLFVPDSKWYEQRLSNRYDEEIKQRRLDLINQVMPQLRVEMQQRFTRLDGIRQQIETQAKGEQSWFREVLRKLDYLLEKFLMFASRAEQYRRYLSAMLREVRDAKQRDLGRPQPADQRRSQRRYATSPLDSLDEPQPRAAGPKRGDSAADPEDYWVKSAVGEVQEYLDDQISRLDGSGEAGHDESTLAVIQKRKELLTQRKESVGKIGKILINLNHQLKLLEDTFGLINDEIQARSPEQILTDIDDVVGQTDTMTRVLEEIAPYEQMLSRIDQPTIQ
jgi:hypothetical protein